MHSLPLVTYLKIKVFLLTHIVYVKRIKKETPCNQSASNFLS